MILFDYPEYDRFFNPLCCRNKRIYYECIQQLIDKSKQVPLLYETEAKDTLTLYFRNLAYAVEDEDFPEAQQEGISSRKTESENAGSVLRYFRSCGWISEPELGRSGDNIAMVMPYCRKLMESIERIFNRDNSAALTNHIFSIYDILHSAFLEDHGRRIRPYSNILVPVTDSMADLKNELLMLRDSIRSVMGMVIKLTETNALGQFLLRDAVMEQFFHDYFFIKKDGLIPGYIDEIEKMLRRLGKSEVYEGMIQEYQALYDVSAVHARETVEKQLAEVRSFISYDYVKDMDDIDRRINRYYNLYSTRVLWQSRMTLQCCQSRKRKKRNRKEAQPVDPGAVLFCALLWVRQVGMPGRQGRLTRPGDAAAGAARSPRCQHLEEGVLSCKIFVVY